MIVAKFGGAVLDNADGFLRACREIATLPRPLVVVVSAISRVTTRLEEIAAQSIENPAGASALLATFRDDHLAIARSLLDDAHYHDWLDAVDPYVVRLGEIVEGLGIVRELSPRTLDLVVHFGERLSSALLSWRLRQEGVAHVALAATDLLLTDTTHRFARPDLDLTRRRLEERLLPHLEQLGLVVTEGYIARSTAGEITTMGRESSDYSATLIGSLVGADEVRIYTGVAGVMTADPRYVPEARPIGRLGYGMATALAELGARVLHPRTVLPIERSRMRLVIRPLDGDGSVIDIEGGDPSSVAVALIDGAELIRLDLEATHTPVDPFLAAIAREAPLVWWQRFRRRFELVVASPWPAHDLPLEKIGGRVENVRRTPVAIVSVIREGGIRGEDLALLTEATLPLAVMSGLDPRGASICVPASEGVERLRELHRRLLPEESVVDGGA